VLIRFDTAELNTLILFLAYTLGHLPGVLDDDEVSDLYQSAEMLRKRIQASCASHNALDVGPVQRGRDRVAARRYRHYLRAIVVERVSE
jgi:hypothetical protein